MARGRLTGFSRFILAMLIIIPLAIVGSLLMNGEEVTVDNITNPEKWTEKKKDDIEVKDDTKIIRTDKDVKENDSRKDIKDLVEEIKNKNKTKEEETTPSRDETTAENKGLKDLLNDNVKNPKKDTEPEVADNTETEVIPVSADVKALQARISRLEDDVKEKDSRIEKLYEEKQTLKNNYESTADSLKLIKKKLDDLKRALN